MVGAVVAVAGHHNLLNLLDALEDELVVGIYANALGFGLELRTILLTVGIEVYGGTI